MNKNIAVQYIFYMNARPITLGRITALSTLLRHHNYVLAAQQNDMPSLLYSSDESASVFKILGSIEKNIAYTAYGSATKLSEAETTIGFNGELLNLSTGLYLLGTGYHRPYHPDLMRFTCPDNLSPFEKGGINAYAYCNNDPVNHTDPSGHWKQAGKRFKKKLERKVDASEIALIQRAGAINRLADFHNHYNQQQARGDFGILTPFEELKHRRSLMFNTLQQIPKARQLSAHAEAYRETHHFSNNESRKELYKQIKDIASQQLDDFKTQLKDINSLIKYLENEQRSQLHTGKTAEATTANTQLTSAADKMNSTRKQ